MTFQGLQLSGLAGPVTALESDETNHEYGTTKGAKLRDTTVDPTI
jgi:hypothetical protein